MSFQFLAQLSHFITMLFGIALGMTICLLYQYTTKIFIFDLAPVILLIVIISIILRAYTMFLWKKNKYDAKIFAE
tara:strand:- start:462 stop:686 length:225 start_codon:yes stop_codon:yes gene_type:complete